MCEDRLKCTSPSTCLYVSGTWHVWLWGVTTGVPSLPPSPSTHICRLVGPLPCWTKAASQKARGWAGREGGRSPPGRCRDAGAVCPGRGRLCPEVRALRRREALPALLLFLLTAALAMGEAAQHEDGAVRNAQSSVCILICRYGRLSPKILF